MLAVIPFFGAFIGLALAANDWSNPCFSDVCEYDLPSTNGTSSGTLKIWGGQGSISDITQAAGWEIIDCSPTALQQNIRLVCKDNSTSSCANLYSGSSGAVGKVVRLPENCGQTAFAVVTKAYTPSDQSIPANIASSLVRRDGSAPQVKALALATQWSSVKTPSTGPVNFAIRAANVPGANGELDTSTGSQRRRNSRIFRRGVFSDFISQAIDDISDLNDFNITNNQKLPPFNIDKKFNLLDQKISCPPIDAGVKVDVDAQAHALASIGLAASGTLIPPAVTDFAVIVNMNAELSGELLIDAQASGTLDSGKIPLFTVGIPGLDFPGILTVGPSFNIDAQATASLDANVDLSVGVDYKVVNAQLVFPPNAKAKNGGTFTIEDTPLLLSASPNATATGTVEAHLIPSLNLGISALGGVVDASVFLELDASASMSLTANAQASASTQIGRRGLDLAAPLQSAPTTSGSHLNTSTPSSSGTTSAHHGSATSKASPSTTVSSAKSSFTTTASSTSRALPTLSTNKESGTGTNSTSKSSANASFSGCFDIGAGFDVNAGATGKFFGLFDAETKVTLFSKNFEIFKKCFGASTSPTTRRFVRPGMSGVAERKRSLKERAVNLSCPVAADASDDGLQTVFDQIIGASSITAL